MTYGDQLRKCAADAFARLHEAEHAVADARSALRSGDSAPAHERLHLALVAEQSAGLAAAEALLRVHDHDCLLDAIGATEGVR